MSLSQILKSHQFPEPVIEIFTQHNITEFYPPQTQAINAGVLDGKNILLSVPTAAGKTLIAELCMLKSMLQNNGRCLYIAPLKALVNEKCDDFTKKYSTLNIAIGSASSDAATSDTILSR